MVVLRRGPFVRPTITALGFVLAVLVSCTTLSGCETKASAHGRSQRGEKDRGILGEIASRFTSKKYDLLIIVDHSGSTRTQKQFAETLRGIGKVYLSQLSVGAKNSLSIRHGGVSKEILYDAKGRGLAQLRQMLDSLAEETGEHHHEDADGHREHEGADGHHEHEGAVAPSEHDESEHHDGESEPLHFEASPRSTHHSARLHVPIMSDEHGRGHGLEMGSPIVETMLSSALAWANGRPKDNPKMIVIVSDLIADATKYQDGCITRYRDPKQFKWHFIDNDIHLRFYMVEDTTINELQEAWKDANADIRFFEPGVTVSKDDLDGVDRR